MLTLITGGVRSGKSSYALELARLVPSASKCFLATAEALDPEIRERISRHRLERGEEFQTLEEPLHLGAAVQKAGEAHGLILIDCMTLWVNNLFYYFPENAAGRQAEIEALLQSLGTTRAEVLIVTNEVGLGCVPEHALARRFMDEIGALNQRLGRLCDRVVLMVSGIPMLLKGETVARLD